ncbi:hypothetical protein [Bradyrhizobium phage BDU-MI-1]|nr:hypothetical protein [Bradyrhizobium phage BDU-MI-1]
MKRRSAPAKALESPLFRQQVIDSRKKKRKAAEKAARDQEREARSARRP